MVPKRPGREQISEDDLEVGESSEPKRCREETFPLEFSVAAKVPNGLARCGRLVLPHGPVDTPVFMPVGTKGSMKGFTSSQLEDLDLKIILANTYHLDLEPGHERLKKFGGLHKFMGWQRNLLTDSGGFQMVSLLKLAEFSEAGVKFQSPFDQSELMLSPEMSMHIQNCIGADIMMALDDVVSSTTQDGLRVKAAAERTTRWLDRCVEGHHAKDKQNLFPIVQGSLDSELRSYCLEELLKRPSAGYAIGGLSGGEDKNRFWKIVRQCTSALPDSKPRYLMGVGYPVDLVVCSCLGCDMFDCVFPTRTGRFGTALVPEGMLNLRAHEMKSDHGPIEQGCDCFVCKRYSRSYLHTVIRKEEFAGQLVSYHNLSYQARLMKGLRAAIRDERLPAFVKDFMRKQFPTREYPTYVTDALYSVGISLD